MRLFTSGTTGTPKGVPIPVRAIASFVTYLEYGLHVTEDDVFWNAADPGWAYGLYYAIIGRWPAGRRSLLLQAGFSTDLTWQVLSRFGVTNLAAAPTVFRSLRSAGGDLPADLRVRRMTSAGEPLNPEMVVLGGRAGSASRSTTPTARPSSACAWSTAGTPTSRRRSRRARWVARMPGWSMAVLRNLTDEPAPAGELGRVAVDLRAQPGHVVRRLRRRPGQDRRAVQPRTAAGTSPATPGPWTRTATSSSPRATTT